MAKKGGFNSFISAGVAMRDVGKRGVATSWLRKAGAQNVLKRIGDETRAVAASMAPAGERSKPKFDRPPRGRKFPFMPSGLFQKKATYTYYVSKRPVAVRIVAGTGYKGAGLGNPRKVYAARKSTYPGYGVQYAGGGSPGKVLKVLGSATLYGRRKGRKRRVDGHNWVVDAVKEVAPKYGKALIDTYTEAVRMRIERAIARGKPY